MNAHSLLSLAQVFTVGLAGGWFGPMSGGPTFITLPCLIFVGLPPQYAIGTNRLGLLGMSIASVRVFRGKSLTAVTITKVLSVLAVIAAVTGASVAVRLEAGTLKTVIAGILLALLLPSFFLNKSFGEVLEQRPKHLHIAGYIGAFLTLIIGALVGGGIGPLMFIILVTCFGQTIVGASATYAIPLLVANLVSLVVFIVHGAVDFPAGVTLFAGMYVGGTVGTSHAVSKGNRFAKRVFLTVSVALAGSLLASSLLAQ